MIRFLSTVRAVLLAATILPVGMPSAFATCADLLDQFNRALEQRDLQKMISLEHGIAVDAACGGRLIEVQRRRAALQLLNAQKLIKQGTSAAESEALVLAADQPQVLWKAANALGDLRFERRRFIEATLAYERALEIIKNPSKTPRAPNAATNKRIYDRAAQARQLAANGKDVGKKPHFVRPPKDSRDGTIGGFFSANIRGFRPTSVPIPITFITASTKFTDVGEAAAHEFVLALREQRPATITIVGHADERGESDYNMRLSSNRAKAVAHYLREHGIAGRVVTIAKGESEPVSISDRTGLTDQDIWSLNRRVEWKRN